MAITFSSRGSSRYLRALGEAPRCIFSPQIDRIVELPRQEKYICFQSSIYYVKWTKFENLLQKWQTLAAPQYSFSIQTFEKTFAHFPTYVMKFHLA